MSSWNVQLLVNLCEDCPNGNNLTVSAGGIDMLVVEKESIGVP